MLPSPARPAGPSFPLRAADVASDRWFPGEPPRVVYREGPYIGYRWFDAAGPSRCSGLATG
ncbi:MAG: hypothetical protein IPF42_15780 [Candidatus Microthrix sp.]|nr:hypothetical protein [Candidatus Microthrix sp.]